MSKDCGGDFFALIGVTLNSSYASLKKLAIARKGTAQNAIALTEIFSKLPDAKSIARQS